MNDFNTTAVTGTYYHGYTYVTMEKIGMEIPEQVRTIVMTTALILFWHFGV